MYRRPPLLSVREEENYDYLDEDHLDESQQVFGCLWLRIIMIINYTMMYDSDCSTIARVCNERARKKQ